MIRRIFALLSALILLAVCTPALGEDVIINKIKNPDDPFEFDPDTALLEVYFPEIFGVDAAYVRYGDYGMLIDCAGFDQPVADRLSHIAETYKSDPLIAFHRAVLLS